MTTLTLQPDAAGGYDTFIYDQYSTRGTLTYLALGKNDLGDLHRILIKFVGISAIPSNAIISSAVMSLYMYSEGSNQTLTYAMYRLLKDWVETEATNEYYRATGQPWGSTGADLIGTDIDSVVWCSGSFINNPTYGWYNFSLSTSEFTKFINGTYLNYGWGLYGTGTVNNNSLYLFYSSDYNTNATLRPKLVVDYIIPSGGSQTIWWFKKWWKEQQEKKPRILLPQGVTM